MTTVPDLSPLSPTEHAVYTAIQWRMQAIMDGAAGHPALREMEMLSDLAELYECALDPEPVHQ